MKRASKKVYRFAEFEVDTDRRRVLRGGIPVKLNDKAFDLLAFMIANNGKIIGKDEILGNVWGGALIEENNLTVQISKIRKILNDTKDNRRFLQTITGSGYCFRAEVSEDDETKNGFHNQAGDSGNSEAAIKDKNKLTWLLPFDNRALTALVVLIIVLSAGFILGIWRQKDPGSFQNVQIERLTSLSKIESAAISPDGKYFAYVLAESRGQSLWIQQINYSNPLLIVPITGVRYWGITFSADSSEIYYSIFAENDPDLTLYRVPALGGRPQKIMKDVGGSVSFSPDAKMFAFITSKASREKTYLKIANADGSGEKILSERHSRAGFTINGNTVSWSPDGKLIAAVVKEIDAAGEHTRLAGIDSGNGQPEKITDKRWAKIKDVVWLKDGRGLVVTASEKPEAPLQVWSVSYPGGDACPITDDLESYENLAIAADNTILAVRISQSGSLSVAGETGYIEQTDIIANQSGGYRDFVWTSPNTLAFISENDIWEIKTDGSGKRQLTQNALIRQRMDFSEAGNYFVFDSVKGGKVNLWRMDPDGNNFKQLTGGYGEGFPAISKDGSFIAYQNSAGYGRAGLWKIDADGANLKEILANSGIRPQVSPDGKQLAFFFMDHISATEERWKIGIISADTGKIARKIEIPSTTVQRFLRWTNNGEALAFIDDKGNESSIIIHPLGQFDPFVKFRTTAGRIESFAWSSDGTKLAVNSSIEIRDAVLIKDK